MLPPAGSFAATASRWEKRADYQYVPLVPPGGQTIHSHLDKLNVYEIYFCSF